MWADTVTAQVHEYVENKDSETENAGGESRKIWFFSEVLIPILICHHSNARVTLGRSLLRSFYLLSFVPLCLSEATNTDSTVATMSIHMPVEAAKYTVATSIPATDIQYLWIFRVDGTRFPDVYTRAIQLYQIIP